MSGFAICPLTLVPVRMSASHRSEMGSQLLYGEMVEILEDKSRQWCKVRCLEDDYIGWVARAQLFEITIEEARRFSDHYAFCLDVFQMLMGPTVAHPVTLGSHLPNFDGIRFMLDGEAYTFSGQAVFPEDIKPGPAMVIKMARKLLNAPFLYGGRSIFGIDSPALVQLAYNITGSALPRTAESQVNRGETVDFIDQARPGDIAFFENNQGKISHSGILLGEGNIIHVNEKVRIDKVDHYGIFHANRQQYTHRLRLVKRIFPQELIPANSPKAAAMTVDNQPVLFG